MKEVTYEDWQKNPTPRMMWVWDYNEETEADEEVNASILIREDDNEWREPLVEV